MTDIEITLNAWEQNFVPVLAVQGESGGRTIKATLVDRTGQTDATFNAESVNRPINLAGTTVRLYCKKPDGTKTFSDGTVTDAENGKASFVLPEQATAAKGNVDAQVYITKSDDSALKIIGLTLQVQESDLEDITSSNDFSSLVVALNEVNSAASTASQAAADAQEAVSDANGAIADINAKESEITTAETERQTNEATRQNNESVRQTAETGRSDAEIARASAESQRQTGTATAITNAETATSNANTAADRANTAAQNAEDAISGQIDPAIDARIAAQKNKANGIAGLDGSGKVPTAQLPDMDYVPNVEKGQPNGIATLDADGHIPAEQLNMNFLGKLVVHVVSEDSGSVAGTRVRIRNEQLGSNYAQTLDALGYTTFGLLDNHTYYVVLLDYPSQYFGAAATVTISGGETQELTLTLKTEPDIVGYRINVATGEVAYTDGAVAFEPMSMADGTLSPGSWEGHWSLGVKPCLLKNMVVQYYLKETGFLLYDYEHQANGSASDIRSGDDGDVMSEMPLMYYKFSSETDPDGKVYRCFRLAKQPQDDTWCSNAFLSRAGAPQSTIYLPAYKGTIYNNRLRSLCGVAPTVSQTISAFRTAANANGIGYEICEEAKRVLAQALFVLHFRGLDGQTLLGKGVTSASAAVASGTLNDKPLIWGDQTGTNGVKYLGMEHFWGNTYDWMDGMTQTADHFLYKIHGPYNDAGSGYLTGSALPASGYIDDMAFANGYGMAPSVTVPAEPDSKYHDQFYQGGAGVARYVGGGWGNGAVAGPFCWGGAAAAYSSPSFGASLFATPQ